MDFFVRSYMDTKPVLGQLPVTLVTKFDLGSPFQSPTIAIALSGSTKSKNVLRLALKTFGTEKDVVFKLIHVLPDITSVPTISGNTVSVSEAPEDVVAFHRRQVMEETRENLLNPFKKMCERKQVAVEVQVVESNNVALAIIKEVDQQLISRLVIGKSSHGGAFSREVNVTSKISAIVSNSCTVYIISKEVYVLSKDKLSSSESERNLSLRESSGDRTDSSSCSSGSGPISASDATSSTIKSNSRSLSDKKLVKLPTVIRGASFPTDTSSVDSDESRRMSSDAADDNSKKSSPGTSRVVSWNPPFREYYEIKDIMSSVSSNLEYGNVNVHGDDYFTHDQDTLKEITKMRAELRHAQEMYALAQVGSLDASRKLKEIEFEELTLKEQETNGFADKEIQKRTAEREVEEEATRKANTKEKLEETSLVAPPKLQYQDFTWEEITTATSSFSEDLKIGNGAYGTVYKCNLHHTIAAVKVLHSDEISLSKQFDQELEILSKIRHPHLVLLLGACPDHGALVYEYMENGSLEDRLFQVNNSQPIPWFVRFRIAWEVASALLFLHRSKPTPIIHRDLKPANILLDHNLVSKVGDVGLSTMIQVDQSLTRHTVYKQTSPVGTLCYIDPEYQRTGMISPKSDVYALGMIILQLLTAQPAIALTYTVELAMENNNDDELIQILDKKAGDWPIEETKQLAALALCCTEIRAKSRPDLKDQILPALEGLKSVADIARNSFFSAPSQPPSHFLCPLLKDVMKEPCIAADGFTYERQAIEAWMENNKTSPVTNLPLQNINLLPNNTLYAAIVEWRRKNQ